MYEGSFIPLKEKFVKIIQIAIKEMKKSILYFVIYISRPISQLFTRIFNMNFNHVT